MTADQIKTIADHAGLVIALVTLGGLLGGGAVFLVRAFFGWERRAELIASRVVQLALASPAFGDAVEKIARAFTDRVEARIDYLAKRDEERAAAVGRLHARMDKHQEDTSRELLDMAKRLPGSGT